MIKVLQITGAMNRGGAEVMIMDIFRNISNEIHFDFLINYKAKEGIIKGDFDNEIQSCGSQIMHIQAQWDSGPIKYIQNFRKIINEIGKPDVVHIHMNSKSGIIALAAKLAGIKKIIVHSHGDIMFKGSFFKNVVGIAEHRFQEVLINIFATDFWGCSLSAVRSLYYSSRIRRGETVVINNAINVDNYLNKNIEVSEKLKLTFQKTHNTVVIGAVGRVVRRKNIKFVIEILKELDKQGVDFVFVNVGKASDEVYMKEVDDKIQEYGLERKVINLGLREDIPLLMSTFDVFVSPAHNEAFGIVAAEAQATGLPTVLSTEFPQAIDMQLGLVLFIKDFDAKLWAKKIIEVKNNKMNNNELIKTQFRSLGFDISENVRYIETLYK
jgi:glycosyltransferase EpsF